VSSDTALLWQLKRMLKKLLMSHEVTIENRASSAGVRAIARDDHTEIQPQMGTGFLKSDFYLPARAKPLQDLNWRGRQVRA